MGGYKVTTHWRRRKGKKKEKNKMGMGSRVEEENEGRENKYMTSGENTCIEYGRYGFTSRIRF